MGRICRKKGFKSGMKDRVGDEKLIIIIIIISVAARGIDDERIYLDERAHNNNST